ncbi:hypothetical protein [Lunatibacter salilacus]|uniref:hypothetical protein n=1 Tax=Lunatibacter salilacus TaxID=2483804 RepID=UPI00131E1B6E|nr:hypothetical protein [Lunatibacter salilacus]
MRSDEVPHHAEVQAFPKEGSTEMVDMAEDKAGALGRVCGETQGYSPYREGRAQRKLPVEVFSEEPG